MEWVSWILIGIILFLALLSNRCSYQMGFWDGCKWFREGPTYPSKPKPGWWGWPELLGDWHREQTKRSKP